MAIPQQNQQTAPKAVKWAFLALNWRLTEWKANKAAKETPLREPAPPALAERLAEFGAELWALALDLANRRLAAERESLDAARIQLEAEKQEAAELADQVTAERAATAEARYGEIEKRADDLNAELQRVNAQNAELVKALAGVAKAQTPSPTKAAES